MSLCRSCEQPVVWMQTVAGKAVPVDAEDQGGWNAPLVNVPDARLRATGDRAPGRDGGTVPVVEALGDLEASAAPAPDERRYRSHFVTCPDAGSWSKRNAKARRG